MNGQDRESGILSLLSPLFFFLSQYIYVKLRPLTLFVSLFSFFLLAILPAVSPNPEQKKTAKQIKKGKKKKEKKNKKLSFLKPLLFIIIIINFGCKNTAILAAKIRFFLSVFHVNWLLNLRSLFLLKRVFQVRSVTEGKHQVITGLISILEVSEC